MIKIALKDVSGFVPAINGMRNPMNSWLKSDSELYSNNVFVLGKNDLKLCKKLIQGGGEHRKFLRMITVWVDLTAPLYWWKEFDTYKVGTVANSCSTMHKIHSKKFEREDFSIDHIKNFREYHWMMAMDNVINMLNVARELYLETYDNEYWWQMIQLLPSSYNQKRTVMLNYEVLYHMYESRKNHKLDEWREFCKWCESLPYFKELFLED